VEVAVVKRIDLVKRGNQWVAEGEGKSTKRGPLKTEAIKKTMRAAEKDPVPVSVKIHKVNGEFDEERTTPRSADPRRSKG
jgi:hypothetical protein